MNKLTALRQNSRFNKVIGIVAALVVVGIGVALIVTHASGFFASVEPEQATLSGNAAVVNDTTASTGKALQFNAPPPVTPPTPPPPSPPLSGWPDANNTGSPAVSTLRNIGGTTTIDQDWINFALDDSRNSKSNYMTGSGTQSDPWVLDKVLVSGEMDIEISGSKWLKVSNSRIYGNSNYGCYINSGNVILDHVTVGPSTAQTSRSTALDHVCSYQASGAFTVAYSNLFGGNVELDVQNSGPFDIHDNFLHNTYFQSGDHTDVINISPHASNGVIRHNTIDGIRNDGQYTHNGIGLYDQAAVSNDTSCTNSCTSNWIIEDNLFDRNQYHLFGAVKPPYIIRNNAFTTRYQTADKAYFYNAYSGFTDGGGNKDENGKALPIR